MLPYCQYAFSKHQRRSTIEVAYLRLDRALSFALALRVNAALSLAQSLSASAAALDLSRAFSSFLPNAPGGL